MQITSSARSALASVFLVGLGMLASPGAWRQPQDPTNLDARLRALEAVLTPENGVKLMNMLPHMTMVELDNGDGTTSTAMRFTGVNVQIVSGSGATNGNPDDPTSISQTTVNTLGNLIVGYNEGGDGYVRTGSHNIVVGSGNQWSSFGGLAVGSNNTISGAYTSVSGGTRNVASGDFSSVSGGFVNTASGPAASLSGGENNAASGETSSISGGNGNVASHSNSSVSGGSLNVASGSGYSVSGGQQNTAGGVTSSVSGGNLNVVDLFGTFGTVSGGCNVTVSTFCGHQ